MKIHDIKVYEGRNIYSHSPCIRADVDIGEYDDIPTCDIPNFNDLLLYYIPTLIEHKCSRGYRGGFVERLYKGTYLAHVIEHIAIELQNILGYDVAFGKARRIGDSTVYSIIYEYKSKIVGEEVLYLAIEFVEELCNGKKNIDLKEKLELIKKKASIFDLGPSTASIRDEALRRGIPAIRLGSGSLLQLGYGCHSKRVQATITENTGCIPVDIACDKQMTKDLLEIVGIPVPKGYVSENLEEILKYAKRLEYPVVVKPNNSNQGKGVSLNLNSEEDIIAAFHIAKKYSDKVIVEKFIEGKHYRVLVVGGKVAACAERIAPYVIGDGKRTIRELIELENQNPLRGEGHEKPLTKIKIDKVMELFLKKNNLTLDYIPKLNEKVVLRENDNLSTGGMSIDVTDDIHPENAELAVNAANIIGLDIAGVDITTKDIRRSMLEDNGAIIEVNAAPGIRMHLFPSKGKQRNVAKEIVDMLFPEGEKHSIPIISITGTNGKTTTTRMLAKILMEKGYVVGMTSTDGVYINEKCIKKGDTTGPLSAKTVLMDKRVEAAVLETARGGIINKGLGYDLADVGILTNISEDHLGLDGVNTLEELAFVKSLVVEAVKKDGYAVLNADDKYCVEIGNRLSGEIIYFSLSVDNIIIQQHIRNGKKVVYLAGDNIIYYDGERERKIISIKDIPCTLQGILLHNVKNALCAVAGAIGVGVEEEYIVKALTKFKADNRDNPGRFNVYEIEDFKLVVDYGHNIEGYRETISALKRMRHNRIIGVIGVPGDRTETSTVKIGQICGENFDYIIIKEDKDPRGSIPGETAKRLLNGCLTVKKDKSNIEIVLKEEEALKKALYMAQRDDIVVIFYEDYDGVMKTIEEARINLKYHREKMRKNA